MYIIREVLNCKPGKVHQLIEKFQVLSAALQDMGRQPLRLMTDVTGEPFWTLVAEATVQTVDEFFETEKTLMANESIRTRMAGYHEWDGLVRWFVDLVARWLTVHCVSRPMGFQRVIDCGRSRLS